jgi:ribosomal protein S18 acetylase RimI-like enzyme
MSAAWDIVTLRPRDLPAYRALRERMLREHPTAFTSDAAEEGATPTRALRQRLSAGRGHDAGYTLGAWCGTQLVGAVTCERESRVKARHRADLMGMMVTPECQGQGLGTALLQACLARARATEGLELLTLSVTEGNAAALHLYTGVGFRRYGTLARAIRVDGRHYDKHLMVLELPAPPPVSAPSRAAL